MSGRLVFATATAVTLAWGALAFGAVYPWAYWPLLVALWALGLWGFFPIGVSPRRLNRNLTIGLMILAAAVSLQLIPLPRETLLAMSPSADSLLREYDMAYAASLTADGVAPRHALSIRPDQTRLALVFLLGLGTFLLGATRGLNGSTLRALCAGVVVVGIVVAMVGIVQKPFFSGRIYGLWTPVAGNIPFGPAGGPFGPFVNRNHFAGWMLMALPLALGHFCGMVARGMSDAKAGWHARIVWLSTREANHAFFVGFAILVMALSLAMTLSRSGITCLLIALSISAFTVIRRGVGRSKSVLVVGYLIALVLLAVAWTGTEVIAARFAQFDDDASARFLAWRDAWSVIKAFPVTGTGLNTYGFAMLFYQSFHAGTTHFAQAHNDYLQLLAEGGVLLAVPVLIVTGLFAYEVSRRFKERLDDPHAYWIRCGAVTSLIAIALQEIVDFSLQMPGNTALFALLCAVAARKASARTDPKVLRYD